MNRQGTTTEESTSDELTEAPALTGTWLFTGHPWDAAYEGRIEIRLQQTGLRLSGDMDQLVVPFTGEPPVDPRLSEADVDGEVIVDPAGLHDLVIIKRISRHRHFRAVFAGSYNRQTDTIVGTFKNTTPGGGTFVMVRTG